MIKEKDEKKCLAFMKRMNALRDLPGKYQEIRSEILDKCGISQAKFYRILSGDLIPGKLERKEIARILKCSVYELWPDEAY